MYENDVQRSSSVEYSLGCYQKSVLVIAERVKTKVVSMERYFKEIMVQLKFQELDSRDHRLQHHNCYCYCTIIMIEITLVVIVVILSQLGRLMIDVLCLIYENDVILELYQVESSFLRWVIIIFQLQLAFRSIYPSVQKVLQEFY